MIHPRLQALLFIFCDICVCVQLNEALCASSPDLASPCEYQSPVDSMNTLALPVRSPRRRSMGVRKTRLCATCSMLIKPATLKNALRLSAMLTRLSPGIPL